MFTYASLNSVNLSYFTNLTDLIPCFDSGFILGKLVRFSHGIRIFAMLFE